MAESFSTTLQAVGGIVLAAATAAGVYYQTRKSKAGADAGAPAGGTTPRRVKKDAKPTDAPGGTADAGGDAPDGVDAGGDGGADAGGDGGGGGDGGAGGGSDAGASGSGGGGGDAGAGGDTGGPDPNLDQVTQDANTAADEAAAEMKAMQGGSSVMAGDVRDAVLGCDVLGAVYSGGI